VVPVWPLASQELTFEKHFKVASQSAADLAREHSAITLSRESPVVVPVMQNEIGPKHCTLASQSFKGNVVCSTHFLTASARLDENCPLAMQFSTLETAKPGIEKRTKSVRRTQTCFRIRNVSFLLSKILTVAIASAKQYKTRRMKTWWVVSFLAIHFLAVRLVFAENLPAGAQTPSPAAVSVVSQPMSSDGKMAESMIAASSPVDECKETLPQLEEQYSQVTMDIRNLNQNLNDSHDDYAQSFQTMTQALVELSHKKEDELQKIVESRVALEDAVQKFNQDKNKETSKALQDSYLNLTVRIYSQAMESQPTIETLKTQIGQVESARGRYEGTQKSQADLDAKKLELEGKMASLKIRCQKN
jgi:hypothetical protein